MVGKMDVTVLLIPALSAIFAGAGAYLGSYLKKKGENLASKEDINDLVEQTKKLTQTTKEIEAKISDESWNRQRQWELKRDIILEFAHSMRIFDQAIMQISIKVKSRKQSQHEADNFSKALAAWNEASSKFDLDSYMVGLVVDNATRMALGDITKALRNAAGDILAEKVTNAYNDHHRNIVVNLEKIRNLIRRELGIPDTPLELATPQSSGSSATPTPGSQAPAASKPEHH